MRKFYSIFALCAFLFLSVSSRAADYTIEPKADGNDPIKSRAVPLLYNTSSTWGSASQQIYLASELTTQGASAGDINAITFYYSASSTIYSNPSARNIQIFLMEIPAEQNAFAIKAANAKSDFLYVSSTNKTAGTKVFEGALNTEAVTSSQTKTVKINFDNSFSWDGSSNLVLTVFDMSATSNTVSAGGFANIRFLISKTSTPRFLSWKWFSTDEDNRAAWIADLSNNLAGREGEYWSTPNTVEGQTANRSYVNKVDFSIEPHATPTVPSVPEDLAASSIGSTSASLSWTAVEGATSYDLYNSTSIDGVYSKFASSATNSYDWSGLTASTTYFVKVAAVNEAGSSDLSEPISFTTLAPHIHDGITFEPWFNPSAMPTSGNYFLNTDVAFDFYEGGYLDLAGNLNLCLNGHTINLGTKSITVTNGKTMTIFDHIGGGKITGFVPGLDGIYTYQGVISVENNGTLVLREGEVENTYPNDNPNYKSIAIAVGGTLILSGAPVISSNEMDIFLLPTIPAKVITIEPGKPLTNTTPYKVYKESGVITSGWANMSGADPKDHFVSANPNKIVCLKDGEAALRTALNLSESSANAAIGDNYNQTVDVNLTRSLTSSQFNTFCLPFALSAAQMEEFFGAGYDLEEFVSSGIIGDELVLSFNKVTSLEAGKPYLLQPSVNVVNPAFEGVTITAIAPDDQTSDEFISFHGTFAPTELAGGNRNLLFLGAGNELFWPEATGNLKGFRAYFEVKGAAQKAKAARIVKKEDQTQAIDNIENSNPAQKRILNGQLVIEKNGTFYNAQGQIVK